MSADDRKVDGLVNETMDALRRRLETMKTDQERIAEIARLRAEVARLREALIDLGAWRVDL